MTKPLKWVWVRSRPKRPYCRWTKWAACKWMGWLCGLSGWHICNSAPKVQEESDDLFEYQFTADTPNRKKCCENCWRKVHE